jgi:hypothetical protein
MKKIVAMFTLLAVLTACGGGGRPSEDEIADSLKDSGNPIGASLPDAADDVIDCIAKALHDSDLSDDALQALVDGDADYGANNDDAKALAGLTEDMAKCATG